MQQFQTKYFFIFTVSSATNQNSRSFLHLPHIQDIIASNHHFSQLTSQLSVYPFLGAGELEVLVGVEGGQYAAVLLAPFKFDGDGLADEASQKGSRITGYKLKWGNDKRRYGKREERRERSLRNNKNGQSFRERLQ